MIAPIDPPPHDPAFLEHADVLRHGMDERVGGKSEFGFDRRGMVVRVVIDSLERTLMIVIIGFVSLMLLRWGIVVGLMWLQGQV